MTPRARPSPWWGVVIADVALEAVREGIRTWRDYRRPPPRRPPEKPATMTTRDMLRRIAIDDVHDHDCDHGLRGAVARRDQDVRGTATHREPGSTRRDHPQHRGREAGRPDAHAARAEPDGTTGRLSPIIASYVDLVGLVFTGALAPNRDYRGSASPGESPRSAQPRTPLLPPTRRPPRARRAGWVTRRSTAKPAVTA